MTATGHIAGSIQERFIRPCCVVVWCGLMMHEIQCMTAERVGYALKLGLVWVFCGFGARWASIRVRPRVRSRVRFRSALGSYTTPGASMSVSGHVHRLKLRNCCCVSVHAYICTPRTLDCVSNILIPVESAIQSLGEIKCFPPSLPESTLTLFPEDRLSSLLTPSP